MAKIISFTGSSGTGKTTLSKLLIERSKNAGMIVSYTTRAKRESDLPGEYHYVSEEEFKALEEKKSFLWTAERRGIRYGTMAKDVSLVANDPSRTGIMILVPETVQKLRDYLTSIQKLEVHIPIFIPAPPKEILLQRLNMRGDESGEIERRLMEDKAKEEELRGSSIPFHFISNNADIEDAFAKIESVL